MREAVIIGPIDDNGVRTRDVDAVFDDRCSDQNIVFIIDKCEHHFFHLLLVHLAVADGDAGRRNDLLNESCDRLDRLDAVVDKKYLPVACKFKLNGGTDNALGKLHDLRVDGKSVARRRLDHRHVAHAEQRHIQRSRDRRRGERENIDLFLEMLEFFLVPDTETLLLIDNDEAKLWQINID